MSQQEQFKALIDAMLDQSEAIFGKDESQGARRMFASTSIKTGGKMFAFLQKKERLVVKLPEERVNALIESGQGERYDPGDGRLQREWVIVVSQSFDDWLALATEAEHYVAKRK